MASKALKQPGKSFFLGNSLSIYKQNTVAARSTRFFLHNQPPKASTPRATAAAAYFAVSPGQQITQRKQIYDLWQKLPQAKDGPSFMNAGPVMTTLRAAFFPMLKRDARNLDRVMLAPVKRGMATHRETGYRSSGSGSSGGGKWGRIFRYLQVPLLVTGGVILFNGIALPYVLQVPGINILAKRPDFLVYGLMGLNLAVFLAWKSPRSFGRQLYKYGLLHKDAQFNKWSMIGSAFSHQEFWHLGVNMFVLYQFGLPVAKWVGSKNFLEMYLDGAVLASLGSMSLPVLVNAFTPWIVMSNVPSLGASGAIFTIFGAFSYLVPYARLSLFFIPLPIGAWYVFLLTMGYNGIGLFYRLGMSDYAGHFAGGMAGILFGKIFSDRATRNRERQVTMRRL